MIRIGIVGCGRILAAHLRGYRALREAGDKHFCITALCARKEEDALMYVRRGEGPPQRPAVSTIPGDPLAVGDEYLSDFQPDVPVQIHTDYRKMIAEAPIDAVNDFSTHALHHQVAREVFAAGKHLLTQKPLAVTVRAARLMNDEAKRRGVTFGVFENFRQSPGTRHLKWFFGGGPGGDLQMILLGYAAAWWAPNRIVAETPWRHVQKEGGGISLDLGVHFFDQIRHVAGEIKSVTGRTAVVEPMRVTLDRGGRETARIACDADDTYFAQFDTDRGTVGNMFATWAGHGGETLVGQGIVFYGSGARVTGDIATFDDGRTASLSALYEQQADRDRQMREFPLGLQNSFALNQLDWLEAIRHKRDPETSGQEGLRDLAAAYAILESHQAGRTVTLEEVLSGEADAYQRRIDGAFGLA